MAAIQPSRRTLDPDCLPTIPAGLFAIIREAGDPDSSLQKLAQVVSMEPVFTTQLLKVVNSPYFGLAMEVRQVHQATVAIGARTVRNLAVAHAVRNTTKDLDLGEFDGMQFWEDSLRRANIARHLAERISYEDPLEAFTIGLIQDVGTLFLAFLAPEHSAKLQAGRLLPGGERHDQERELTGKSHTDIFAMTAATWEMPKDLVEAVVGHHDPRARATGRRGRWLLQLARVADAIGDLFQAGASSELQQIAQGYLNKLPSRKPLLLQDVCQVIRQEVVGSGRELGIKVSSQPTWTQMVSAANRSLLHINERYEELTQELEQKNAENARLLAELQESNRELHRLATTDTLTGVANRRSFTKILDTALQAAQRDHQPISILMCDADNFKLVNDNHGHAIGDDVLVELAARLVKGAREIDTVGRLGGEEFAIILPAAGASRGQVMAEKIRQGLGARPILCRDGTKIHQTASFGGYTWDPRNEIVTADQVLQAADHQCYVSKRSGRNRVSWQR